MKNIVIDEKFKTPEFYTLAKLPVSAGKDIILIPLSSIIYIESDGSYSKIYNIENENFFHTCKNIGQYEKSLPPHSFVRIHSKFLVNVTYIKNIVRESHWKVGLINQIQLNVSDEKKEILLQKLGLNYE
jgi:two-component system LytT family response regulator